MCFEVYYANSQGKQFILFPGNLSVEILGKRDVIRCIANEEIFLLVKVTLS